MRKIFQTILITSISLLLSELICQLWVLNKIDEFLLARNLETFPPVVDKIEDTRQKLSPIFGYSYRSGWRASEQTSDLEGVLEMLGESKMPDYFKIPANNYGFFSEHDYPYVSDKNNAFYVVVTGGSVANGFALVAEKQIKKAIRAVPKFEDYEIVLINLANGGYKQPQQVQAVGYFLSIGQPVDMIINMDGLNEAYIGWSNVDRFDVEYSLPHGQFLYGLLNNFISNNSIHEVGYYSNIRDRTRSGIIWLYADALVEREKIKRVHVEQEASMAKAGRNYPMTIQKPHQRDMEAVSVKITDTWERGSYALKGLSDAFDAIYIHALQPNQYHSQKTFLAEERSLAFSEPEWDGAKIVRQTYPRLIEAGMKLKDKGIQFVDLTNVFKNRSETIYFDACCHFRKLGYELIMSDVMTGEIVQAFKRK